jgi:hypothetical protein
MDVAFITPKWRGAVDSGLGSMEDYSIAEKLSL